MVLDLRLRKIGDREIPFFFLYTLPNVFVYSLPAIDFPKCFITFVCKNDILCMYFMYRK